MPSYPPSDLASVRQTIYDAISAIRLIDPHTHINPHDAGSHTLADILGYHYYTELVHSAGMPRTEIEEPGITPRELVRRMVHGLGNITNTANYHWLIQICREFFDFQEDTITVDNWEALYDAAEAKMDSANWPQSVLDQSNVEAVFLTNDFDDDLEGFDTSVYIPCLRTDDLVFHLAKPEVRQRLEGCSEVSLDGSLDSLRAALRQRFEHFVSRGARACAISLPPNFSPKMVSDGRAKIALDHLMMQGTAADPAHLDAVSRRVFWTLAELCDEFGLPFDLMIGVNRQVYPAGVFQGQDLYDSRVSLIQYRDLFNTFPKIKFPISVLASVTNQELVSYSWIFPNVFTNGHWWYSNTPSFIHRDAAARLEAVPRNKQVAYYSDAYKLEFVLPKFDMYRRILARVLAEQFVGENGWSEEKAIELGRQVLRGNVDELFRSPLLAGTPDDLLASQPDSGSLGVVGINESTIAPPPTVEASDVAAASAVGGVAAMNPLSIDLPDLPASMDPLPVDDDSLDTVDESNVENANASEPTDPQGLPTELASDPSQSQEVGRDQDLLADEQSDGSSEEISELSAFLEADADDGLATIDDDTDQTVGSGSIPTVTDVNDTVQSVDAAEPIGFVTEEIDPLPSSEELDAAEVPDVTLAEIPHASTASTGSKAPEPVPLDAEIDPIPLDVGNLLGSEGENPSGPEGSDSPIQMLAGDGQFTPDGDSMILEPDPTTGELRFPVGDEDDEK